MKQFENGLRVRLDRRTLDILVARAERQGRPVSSLARRYIVSRCQQPEGGGSLKDKPLLG